MQDQFLLSVQIYNILFSETLLFSIYISTCITQFHVQFMVLVESLNLTSTVYWRLFCFVTPVESIIHSMILLSSKISPDIDSALWNMSWLLSMDNLNYPNSL
jgi:hypothetical protein